MKNPIVLADFHHASLLNSLVMLFEDRLNGMVFRPIGVEWAEQGFWKVYDHPATIQQFLGIGGASPDGTAKLNEVVSHHGGLSNPVNWYNCRDIEGDKTNRAITLQTFYEIPIDIVIASIPAHIEPFKKLCETHGNQPKLIYQIGNQWIPEQGIAPNIMASAKMPPIPGTNFISYHQEFDLEVFKYIPPVINPEYIEWPGKQINSFINVFQNFPDYDLFERVQFAMGDWTFKSYGGQCRDGSANGSVDLAEKMAFSRFIWHTKAGGDGYGHIVHNSGAVGRPMIVKKSYYAGSLGGDLMIDGETCIDIDGLSEAQIIEKILFYNEPERYNKMCEAVRANFRAKVDFDAEAEKIKGFLENLI